MGGVELYNTQLIPYSMLKESKICRLIDDTTDLATYKLNTNTVLNYTNDNMLVALDDVVKQDSSSQEEDDEWKDSKVPSYIKINNNNIADVNLEIGNNRVFLNEGNQTYTITIKYNGSNDVSLWNGSTLLTAETDKVEFTITDFCAQQSLYEQGLVSKVKMISESYTYDSRDIDNPQTSVIEYEESEKPIKEIIDYKDISNGGYIENITFEVS